jgi:ankyrin repeat protein
VLDRLLVAGANVNTTNERGDTALTIAAAKGHGEIIAKLAGAGADVHHVDHNGDTALAIVTRNGHVAVVDALLAISQPSIRM